MKMDRNNCLDTNMGISALQQKEENGGGSAQQAMLTSVFHRALYKRSPNSSE
jgi:hypothetical protein